MSERLEAVAGRIAQHSRREDSQPVYMVEE